MHNIFGFIALIGAAWVLQYALTWLQIRHYRNQMRQMVTEYDNTQGYSLFSGVARKAAGSGAIVLLVVDRQLRVRECRVLSGVSVFAKFKPETRYNGKRVGEVIAAADEILAKKRKVSSREQSLARALKMAAENAVRSKQPVGRSTKSALQQ